MMITIIKDLQHSYNFNPSYTNTQAIQAEEKCIHNYLSLEVICVLQEIKVFIFAWLQITLSLLGTQFPCKLKKVVLNYKLETLRRLSHNFRKLNHLTGILPLAVKWPRRQSSNSTCFPLLHKIILQVQALHIFNLPCSSFLLVISNLDSSTTYILKHLYFYYTLFSSAFKKIGYYAIIHTYM